MALQLRKAERKKAKLKLGMSAPSGGGKTLGALFVGYGLMKEKYPKLAEDELWSKICIVDSENGSGELYVNSEKDGIAIGVYNVITLDPPFTPEKYINSILLCYNEGLEVCIIDSASHLWAGSGGLLDQQGQIAKRQGYNSYTAWREITPLHNKFVDTMLQTDIHIISTMRSKQEYVQEKDEKGSTKIRKIGLNPVARDGMEFEFTAFLEIDSGHTAFGSKDRTGIVDQRYFKITPEIGKEFMKWLDSGSDESKPPQIIAEAKEDAKQPTQEDRLTTGIAKIKELTTKLVESGITKKLIADTIKTNLKINGKPSANFNAIKDLDIALKVFNALKELESKKEDK